MRRLWITRINSGLKSIGVKYSEFIYNLNKNDEVNLNRKSLSEIAFRDMFAFTNIVKSVMPVTVINQFYKQFEIYI